MTYTLGDNLENLALSGSTAIDGTGNVLANVLTGNSAVNVLSGGAGNDTLDGGGGNDVYLFGKGDGQDTITEAPDATVGRLNLLRFKAGVAAGEVTVLRVGDDLRVSIAGVSDTVTVRSFFLGASATSSSNPIQRIEFFDGTAWDLATIVELAQTTDHAPALATPLADQTILQGAVFNLVVSGSAFSDPDAGDALTYSAALATGQPLPAWLSFDAASRTFSGNSALASGGVSSIRVIVTDSAGLTASDVFDLTVQSPADGVVINGTPGDDVLMAGTTNDTLHGGAGDDQLIGGTGNNLLLGEDGNDSLSGGGGFDTLVGGTGDDRYDLVSLSDVIVEQAGEGTDLVRSAFGYALGANLENLTLTGSGAVNATGNTQDNVLTGNAGSQRARRQAGADTMTGGAGNDTYVVDKPATTS